MGGTKMADTGAEVMISAVRSNPQLAPYEDVFVAWYKQTMAKVDLESKMVALYAETFTEKELKDLTAFYRAPLGRKALQKMPELMRRGAEIGTAAAKDNQAELERMLEVRRKEIEEKDKQAAKDAWTTPTPTAAPSSTPTPAAGRMR
jgi:hypothetical protein